MPLSTFVARATTCEIAPGREQADDSGKLQIRDRVFTDIVESADARLAGNNRVTLDLDIDPKIGEGTLRGRFELQLNSLDGAWEGELDGALSRGLVTAFGVARGSGALDGASIRIDFRQVAERAGLHPCETPLAFFDIDGFVLERS